MLQSCQGHFCEGLDEVLQGCQSHGAGADVPENYYHTKLLILRYTHVWGQEWGEVGDGAGEPQLKEASENESK